MWVLQRNVIACIQDFFFVDVANPPIYYESQPVGLAEVIDASEGSLGGPGGRAGKMSVNRVKQAANRWW